MSLMNAVCSTMFTMCFTVCSCVGPYFKDGQGTMRTPLFRPRGVVRLVRSVALMTVGHMAWSNSMAGKPKKIMDGWVSFGGASPSPSPSVRSKDDDDELPPPPNFVPRWEQLVAMGDDALSKGEHTRAIELYTGALDQCPPGPGTKLPGSGEAGIRARRSSALIASLTLHGSGNAANSGGGIAQALRDAVKCVEICPEWGGGHACLAGAWAAAGQIGKAMAAVERGVAAAGDCCEELIRVKTALESRGKASQRSQGGSTSKASSSKASSKAAQQPAKSSQKPQGGIDDSMADGLMSGTFRWAANKDFFKLPPFPGDGRIEHTRGWGAFLSGRDPTGKMTEYAQRDSSLLDCLTFPLTVAFWLSELGMVESMKEVNIVCLGATRKCEGRVLHDTRCWHELGHIFPSTKIKLWLVGPEMDHRAVLHPRSVNDLAEKLDLPPNMEVMLQKMGPPCAAPFLEHHRGDLGAHNTLLVTFNGGFGNSIGGGGGDSRLFWDWYGDLCAISDSGIPALFTCANDYADAEGETLVQAALIGARFVRAPSQNPYHAGSTFQGEGDDSWFCANHSCYVIQGCIPSRRCDLDSSSAHLRDADLKQALAGKRGLNVNRLIGALAQLHIPVLEAQNQPKVAEDAGAEAKNGGGAVPDRSGDACGVDAAGSVEERGGVGGVEVEDASKGGGVESGGSVSIDVEEEEEEEEEEEGWERPVCSIIEKEEAYVLSAHMPKMQRLDGAALEVSGDSVMFQSCGYIIDHAWPSPVDAESCSARFSKKKRTLTVTAPRATAPAD